MPIEIRAGDRADYPAFTALFGELAIPDPVPGPDKFAQAIVPILRVACEGDAVIGYVTWRPYGELAHVIQLAVDPVHRGRRVGEELLRFAAGEARAAGCRRWYLNVKRDNTPALRLYERCGLAQELETWAMKIAWDRVPRSDVIDELAGPGEDAALAARFGVPVERLASFRARGLKLVVAREGASAVALAPFDPAFPGAPVFCAARADLAGALLDALRRHADPRFDYVRVTVEGDRALAEQVRAMGAELTFELLRLSAAL
jgi:GNAT superfamily N-acetyltransferase